MSCGVYTIIHHDSLKMYVGKGQKQVDGWCDRWTAHMKGGSESLISSAIQAHGVAAFTFGWIEDGLTDAPACATEIRWIAFWKTNVKRHGHEFGFNRSDGGEGASYDHQGSMMKWYWKACSVIDDACVLGETSVKIASSRYQHSVAAGTVQRYVKKNGHPRFKAHLNWLGKKRHLGTFDSEDEARAAIALHQQRREHWRISVPVPGTKPHSHP